MTRKKETSHSRCVTCGGCTQVWSVNKDPISTETEFIWPFEVIDELKIRIN